MVLFGNLAIKARRIFCRVLLEKTALSSSSPSSAKDSNRPPALLGSEAAPAVCQLPSVDEWQKPPVKMITKLFLPSNHEVFRL